MSKDEKKIGSDIKTHPPEAAGSSTSKGDHDPLQRAVALQYSEKEKIPKILATGSGDLARQIVELALANKIPVEKDETLASLLSQLKPGDAIPPETYRLLAEIIAFLYESDQEWRESHKFLDGIFGNAKSEK